jgi:hypothetical protein
MVDRRRVGSVLDRLAHESTVGCDLESTVFAFRRLLNGQPPSQWLDAAEKRPRRVDRAVKDAELIASLRAKVTRAEHEKTEIEREKNREIKRLEAEVIDLRAQLLDNPAPLGFVSLSHVNRLIYDKFRKHHGVIKALITKNAEWREDDAILPKITESLWQSWQRANAFPQWVVAQLGLLTEADLRSAHRWSVTDKNYLTNLWREHPDWTNDQLAAACANRFGCPITDAAVKGVLHRSGLLRRQPRNDD